MFLAVWVCGCVFGCVGVRVCFGCVVLFDLSRPCQITIWPCLIFFDTEKLTKPNLEIFCSFLKSFRNREYSPKYSYYESSI